MKRDKALILALAAVLAFVGGGCEKKPAAQAVSALEVNDENCKPANVAKIGDKAAQRDFAARCLRRSAGGEFKPSPKREW